jgi:hypothetical protein
MSSITSNTSFVINGVPRALSGGFVLNGVAILGSATSFLYQFDGTTTTDADGTRYLVNNGTGENALLTDSSDYLLSKARQSISAGAQALEDEIVSELDSKIWTGFPDDQEWDKSFTVTSPSEFVAITENYKTQGLNKAYRIICDWDGLSPDLIDPNQLRGNLVSYLTPDSTVRGGYVIPDGGIQIIAAEGRTPAFRSFQTNIKGFARFELNGVGVACGSVGKTDWAGFSKVYALNCYNRDENYPLPTMFAIKNCTIGNGYWLPDELPMNYTGFLKTQGATSTYFNNNKVKGFWNLIKGTNYLLKATNNFIEGCLEDVFHIAGHGLLASSPDDKVLTLIENNVVCNQELDIGGYNFHRDFVQAGAGGDSIKGYDIVVRNNLVNMFGQGVFVDDYFDNDLRMCVHNNIMLLGLNNAVLFTGLNSNSDSYVEKNTLMSYGGVANGNAPNIRTSSYSGTGVIHVKDNVFKGYSVDPSKINDLGNIFVNSLPNVVSGDGLTSGSPLRPEDFFIGSFSRDGNDYLLYSLPNETSSDKTQVIAGFKSMFETIQGWDGVGSSEYRMLKTISWDGNDLTELNADANADGFTVTDEDGLVVKNI